MDCWYGEVASQRRVGKDDVFVYSALMALTSAIFV
jgi:hypothetical protein